MEKRRCPQCYHFRLESEFEGKRQCSHCLDRAKAWYHSNKDRINAERKKRRKEDPEWAASQRERKNAYVKNNPRRRKSWDLKATYGITLEEYEAMLADQENCCAICGRPPSDFSRNFHVDHDHGTGRVRALLCGPCNVGIGQLQHDPKILRSAATYLENHAPA